MVCCLGLVGTRDEPSEFSNRGSSPSDNPSSTVCYYYKTSNCMVCQGPSLQEKKCCTQPLPVGDVTNIIANEYLIPVFTIGSGGYELHPLQLDGTYSLPGENGFDWSINTATSSSQLGVTVLNDNSCWDDMRIVIDEGSFLNDFFEFRGFLYVVD
ncbi:uncharacterized protein LOC117300265 [Asterias rubens]|uniref:uncharacterized protein LOC117300265 n=1 Tax=Asterias rubens TaxID=7604 RepID=UPI00145590EE|nr:uncharacterized protein LOC117300265 [Asterias rubens]